MNAHRPGGGGGVARSATGGGANTSPLVIAKKCETLKTLSYDCGNPVQYVCGRMPAVLFYLLDRHAPLAMTKGSKYPIPQSLTTPAASRHPSNGGELSTFPSQSKFPFTTDMAADSRPIAEQSSSSSGRIWLLSLVLLRSKFPSAEGWHDTGPRENAIFVGGCGGVVYHPKPRRRVTQVTNNQPGHPPRFYITLP